LGWSVNLNIVSTPDNTTLWEDLEKRLDEEVNWSIYAKLYDQMLLRFPPYKHLIQKTVRMLNRAPTIVDLAAGTGNVTLELLKHNPERKVWALESNEEMIEHFRRKLNSRNVQGKRAVKILKGDLMVGLREFEKHSLDAAIMINGLYALSDPARCIREIYRVLKPGGLLVYSTSTTKTNITHLFDAIRKEFQRKGILAEMQHIVDVAEDRHFQMKDKILENSQEDIVNFARQAGFTVDEDGDVFPNEYEGAVTIVRAIKPKNISLKEDSQDLSAPLKPRIVAAQQDKTDLTITSEQKLPKDQKAHIFISYAREDSSWCNRIVKFLKPAIDSGKIQVWFDDKIQSGELWAEKIMANIDQASIAILLISPDFLASDFIRKKEMTRILEKRRRESLTVIPVMITKSWFNEARYLFPDSSEGPYELTLSDLHIKVGGDTPLMSLDDSQQNVAIHQLAEFLMPSGKPD